jgi:DNA repair photolyase
MLHGSRIDPPNRFEKVQVEPDLEHVEWDKEYLKERTDRAIEYLEDASLSIVSKNDSPDVGFKYSVNPYRGCVHGCSYCYARNSHEYLGMNAGLDFETKVVVKHDAPRLFREFLANWRGEEEPVIFSGVTDCYQPAERRFRLTRQCLEVALECRQPVCIITKNALVLRDLDVLQEMAKRRLVALSLSITTLDAELARAMEPRTSVPSARLRAVQVASDAGIPVRVMVAPIIPGLNDSEVPSILEAVKNAGATTAEYVLVRLPLTVRPVFQEWLRRTQPLRWKKIEGLIRQTRAGKLNDSNWGDRLSGVGEIAEQIGNVFSVFKHKFGLDRPMPSLDFHSFKRPKPASGQLRLF